MSPSNASVSMLSAYAMVAPIATEHKKHRCESEYNKGLCDKLLQRLSDSIFKFVEDEVAMMKLKRLLYLSVDGTSPIVKRRLLTSKGLCCHKIKAGTELMRFVSARLKSDIKKKKTTGDEKWIELKDTYCGILALLTHEVDISVYSRVDPKPTKGDDSVVKENNGVVIEENTKSSLKAPTSKYTIPSDHPQEQGQGQLYKKTKISTLIEVVMDAIHIQNKYSLTAEIQIEDFVLMCSPVGNDYMAPAYHSLEINYMNISSFLAV